MTPGKSSDRRVLVAAVLLFAIGAVAGATLYASWERAVPHAGRAVNLLRPWSTPASTAATEPAMAPADPMLAAATPAVLRMTDGNGARPGDHTGVPRRMVALDATTGQVAWEFYLLPRADSDSLHGPQGMTPLDRSTQVVSASIAILGQIQ